MFIEVDKGHNLPHDPFKAIIAPRPIGWISTMSARGEVNLAPYSFFNIISERPHLVAFSSQGCKDSMTFAEEGGDFVCNIATWGLREQVNQSSALYARGTNEMDEVGLVAAPSQLVRSPRVAAAPAALECRWLQTIALRSVDDAPTGFFLVIGQLLGIHIDDKFLVDGLVDTAAMNPLLRGGYRDFFTVTSATHTQMMRPAGGGRRDDV